MLEFTEFMILVTAAVFTLFGRYVATKNVKNSAALIVEFTIDKLVQDGYIRTKTTETGEVELVRYNEYE